MEQATAVPKPISKSGAVARMALSAAITFGVSLQTAHGSGMKIDAWVLFGAVILAAKDIQSFINLSWGKAFHEARAGDPAPSTDAAPPSDPTPPLDATLAATGIHATDTLNS